MEVTDDWVDDRPWDTGGVYRVAAGVYRLPLPLPHDGLRAVNVYALEAGAGLVLIDSGQALDVSRAQLGACLDALGYRLQDVQRFLVTHIHRDHYTQAVAIRRELGTSIALGAGEQPSFDVVRRHDSLRAVPQLQLLRSCGAEGLQPSFLDLDDGLSAGLWEDPDDWLDSGQVIDAGDRRLDVVHTPGHTRGHVVFRDGSAGVLFAGDHILSRITPSIGFEPAVTELPLRDYLRSLQLIRALGDTWLFPAHGPVMRSAHDRIDQLLEHHAERLSASLGRVGLDGTTALQVAEQLHWTRRRTDFSSLSPFNQILAVLETKAHLDVLVDRGRLTVLRREGVDHFLAG